MHVPICNEGCVWWGAVDGAGRVLTFDRPHSLGSGYENDNLLKGGECGNQMGRQRARVRSSMMTYVCGV